MRACENEERDLEPLLHADATTLFESSRGLPERICSCEQEPSSRNVEGISVILKLNLLAVHQRCDVSEILFLGQEILDHRSCEVVIQIDHLCQIVPTNGIVILSSGISAVGFDGVQEMMRRCLRPELWFCGAPFHPIRDERGVVNRLEPFEQLLELIVESDPLQLGLIDFAHNRLQQAVVGCCIPPLI